MKRDRGDGGGTSPVLADVNFLSVDPPVVVVATLDKERLGDASELGGLDHVGLEVGLLVQEALPVDCGDPRDQRGAQGRQRGL